MFKKVVLVSLAFFFFFLANRKEDFAFAQQNAIVNTVESLDAAWENRHLKRQMYIEYCKKRPELPEDYEVLWRVSLATYYVGFFAAEAEKDSVKIACYLYGIEAGKKATRLRPDRVEGYFWLSTAVAGYGLTNGIRESLGRAEEMKQALDKAVKIDPTYWNAGPYRNRGRLFFKLPSFISFGDNKKAYEDLKKSVELGPKNKLNYQYFAEVQVKIEDEEAAIKTLEKALELPDVEGVDEELSYRKDIQKLIRKYKE